MLKLEYILILKVNFAKLCEGVVVQPPPNQVIPHTHKFK